MDCLLFGGTKDVGKTEAIYGLATRLLSRPGFSIVAGNFPARTSASPPPDFRIIISGTYKNGAPVIIAINSPTDDQYVIDLFKQLLENNKNLTPNIIISSVRDTSWPYERKAFFKTTGISSGKDFIIEFPLAKIYNWRGNLVRFQYYRKQVDELADHILSGIPFNL